MSYCAKKCHSSTRSRPLKQHALLITNSTRLLTDNLSGVRNLGARELTIYLSLAAATSTPPTTRTSSAQTKKTTATLSNDLRSSSNLSTSSGQTGLTTSTTLAYAATPVAAVSSSAASGPSRSSPSSHSNTAAVAAGTAGAIIGAIIALVLMLLVLRWRKRRTEDNSWATQHDNGPRSHNNVANGARTTFQDNVGSGESLDFALVTSFATKLSQQGACKRYLFKYMIISIPCSSLSWALLRMIPSITCSGPCR